MNKTNYLQSAKDKTDTKKDSKPKKLPFTIYVDITLSKRGTKKAVIKNIPLVTKDGLPLVRARFQEFEETLNEAINSAHRRAKTIYGYITAEIKDTKNFHEEWL